MCVIFNLQWITGKGEEWALLAICNGMARVWQSNQASDRQRMCATYWREGQCPSWSHSFPSLSVVSLTPVCITQGGFVSTTCKWEFVCIFSKQGIIAHLICSPFYICDFKFYHFCCMLNGSPLAISESFLSINIQEEAYASYWASKVAGLWGQSVFIKLGH